MAETAATALGIAGVVGVLQSLIQCYKEFLTARDFGDDYAYIQLRTALLENSTKSWAIAVGLIDETDTYCNKFLVARPTEKNVKLVEETLLLIRTQLNVANDELATYLVDRPAPQGALVAPAGVATSANIPHFPTDTTTPKDKQSVAKRVGNKVQRTFHRQHDEQHPGTLKRINWALIDKEKIEKPLDKVKTLVDHLNTDFAPVDQKQQLDRYCQGIKDLKLDKEELEEVKKTAGDRVSQIVLKMLENERQTGNRFNGMNVTKDGSVNIGDFYDNDWKGEGMTKQHERNDVYQNLTVTDSAFVSIGNTYGGKSPMQIRHEQMQAARQARSGGSGA